MPQEVLSHALEQLRLDMSTDPAHSTTLEVSAIEKRSETPSPGSVLLELLEEGEVVCEGPLQQFKPGITSQFVERWCQLTPRTFRYYKSQWCAKVIERKPLFLLPRSRLTVARQYHPSAEERQGVFRTHRFLFELVISESTEQELSLRPQWRAKASSWEQQHLLFSARTKEECMQWVAAFETASFSA